MTIYEVISICEELRKSYIANRKWIKAIGSVI